jgi:serine/threonine-protein kinase
MTAMTPRQSPRTALDGADDPAEPQAPTTASTQHPSASDSIGPSSGDSIGGTDESTPTIIEGEVLADRYRIHHRLGKGGMGEVFLARHVAIGRMVAIKTLGREMRERAGIAQRFLREAQTSSMVRHPNVVDILDFGHTERGTPFFVMEYLEGEDLKSVLKRERVLSWERSCAIVTQVCAGLAAAHAQNVIHRDLKPDNIYLVMQDGREVVKVLDFGIAKIVSGDALHDATQTGVLLGTPEYMSPEQARDEVLDARSDIYACGVMLYRMLTGRLPFRAKSFMAVLSMHLQNAPIPPRQLDPPSAITEAQEAVILRCLAKARDDRYPSADALAQALRAADQGLAPSSTATLPVELGAAPTRTLLLLGGLAVVSLTAVVGLFFALRGPASENDPTGPNEHVPAAMSPPTPTVAPTPPEAVTKPAPDAPVTPPALPAPDKPATKSKGKTAPKTSTRPASGPIAAIGSSQIQSALAGIRDAVAGCSELGIPGTTLRVEVAVSVAGKVVEATAPKSVQGSELGDCVEKAARRARFPALVEALRVTLTLRL